VNRKKLIYIFSVVLALGIILVIYQNSTSNAKKFSSTKPKKEYVSSNWKKKYGLKNKNPFGLFVFQELAFADAKFMEFNAYSNYKFFDSVVGVDSSLFMFIGKNFTLTEEENEKIMASVFEGNELFISVETLPDNIVEQFFLSNPILYFTGTVATHTIDGNKYDFYYIFENDTVKGFWEFFNQEALDNDVELLTMIGKHGSGFIQIKYGSGNIFIHLNPNVFTNHHLLTIEGKEYLKDVLQVLNQPKIQWFSFVQYEPILYNPNEDLGSVQANPSLLIEIFKHPAFRWGFILAVFGVILYLFFRSKRRRPVVPAYIQSKNTGFSYVDTLAGIYYSKKQPNKILNIMRQNLYHAIYNKFYIDMSHREDNDNILSLSKKADISQEEINYLFKIIESKGIISNEYLSNAYALQRDFYFKSGIWDFQRKDKFSDKPIHIYRNKKQAVLFATSGFLLIVLGFVLLAKTSPLGVLLWPFGGIALFSGMRSLSTPALLITPEKIELTPFIGFSKSILYENIKFINQKSEKLIIVLKTNKKISLSMSNLEKNNINILNHIQKNIGREI